MVLFSILSLVFFIRIVGYTAIIKLSLWELIKLYLYMVPRIILFTMPFSFFIALTTTFFNLSKESETTVIFALGYSPKKIADFFFYIALFLSIFLIFNSLVLVPLISKQMYKKFITYKKVEAKLNIKATEFGQSYGDWMVYINRKEGDKIYKNVVLFNKKSKEGENFIFADSANLSKKPTHLEFKLKEGKVFNYSKNELEEIEYRGLSLNMQTEFLKFKTSEILEYWLKAFTDKRRFYDLILYLISSLFPLLTYKFAFSIGIVNSRDVNINVYPRIFLVIFGYLTIGYLVGQLLSFLLFFGFVILTYIVATIRFNRKVLTRY